jgi:hypothetical protein
MNKASVINSFLVATCLGVMGWVGHKAAENAEQLAGLRASVDAVKESVGKVEVFQKESLQRMERKLDEMVPHREFEAKLTLVEVEQRKFDLRLRELDLEILKLKR